MSGGDLTLGWRFA